MARKKTESNLDPVDVTKVETSAAPVEPVSELDLSLGEVAYLAFNGVDEHPLESIFSELPVEEQTAWQAAGNAVAGHVGRVDKATVPEGFYETCRRNQQGAIAVKKEE